MRDVKPFEHPWLVIAMIVTFFTCLLLLSIFSKNTNTKIEERLTKELQFRANENICYLSSIITAECNLCTEEEKYLIGSVVINRSEISGRTIQETLEEENQFYGYFTSNFYPTEEHTVIATRLLAGEKRTRKFLFFFRGEPCWSLNLKNAKRETWHHTFSY